MAAQVKYELSTKVERGGKERWHRLGVVLENDKGMYAIIDSIPVGFTGMVSFFVPKEREQGAAQSAPAAAPAAPRSVDDLTDDIPF